MHSSKIQTVRDKPLKLPLKMIVLTSKERIIKSKRVLAMLNRDFWISIFCLYGDNSKNSTFLLNPQEIFNPDILSLRVKTIILRGNFKGLSLTVWIFKKCIFNVKTTTKNLKLVITRKQPYLL